MLERLSGCSGEITVIRNMVNKLIRSLEKQLVGNKDVQNLGELLDEMHKINGTIQTNIVDLRKVPLSGVLKPIPRIIRDLTLELNKKIDLQMIGAETELDRQVLELIKDPLTHMVRNSADHGVEMPAERIKAGKPETGRVTLHAYHEGGHIIIEISDDGRGLALDRIKAKAVQNGLATEAELAGMSDQQIMQFIFKPGFSTAAKVTSVSGRGVGMDVVRTNIEKIGGTVHLALGAAYPETGCSNQSALHWDMICDLRQGGVVTADGQVIHRDGHFV
jgi:two-component system chemotaxis sensor kinase CheA